MSLSFTGLSREERAERQRQMAAVVVDDAEIEQFDRMILHRAHRCFVARKAPKSAWRYIYADNAVIGNTGLTIDDLLQVGRVWVLHQIRYYRCFGDQKLYGARLSTMIQTYLDNKFITYGEKFSRLKRGGGGFVTGMLSLDDVGSNIPGGSVDPENLMLINESIRDTLGGSA